VGDRDEAAEVGLEEGHILTQQGFGQRMSARFAKARCNKGARYLGIGLRTSPGRVERKSDG
jgi:hypothetical protein